MTSDPASYSLYNAGDVTSAEATARTAGQNDVTTDPATYNLYTAAQFSNARRKGIFYPLVCVLTWFYPPTALVVV